MPARKKGRGLIYLRRSQSKQETSFEQQLHWALEAGVNLGISLDARLIDLQHMLQKGLHRYRDLRLDDAITGADLTRPGFLAVQADILADQSISHLFIYKRDRFARPEDAMDASKIEKSLRQAGVTFVMSEGVAQPLERGAPDFGEEICLMFAYHESGEFLRKLADRAIETHRHLAERGYRTGGNAPYGFVRILVDPQGQELEVLTRGKSVRQPGCHVRIRPDDPGKLKVWVYILDLRASGWGIKRIAAHLNLLDIPSPDAGRERTDHGVRHAVSGKWSPGTVADLCRNKAILGILEYGRRSEGQHRRLGAGGKPRLLNDSDRRTSGKVRLITNDKDVVIQSEPRNFTPIYPVDRWQQLEREIERRGQSQRGIPRSPDPAKYPTAGRVFDMTEGCGSVMHSRTSGQRRLHECSLYRSSGGTACYHNTVDAEAMLRFVLKTLQQMTQWGGRRERLREMLQERARRAADHGIDDDESKKLRMQAERRLQELDLDFAAVKRNWAREENDELREELRSELIQLKSERDAAESHLGKFMKRSAHHREIDEEVDAALSLCDDITRITSDPSARADINPMLRNLGIRVGLRFDEVVKGKKRKVRRLAGGVMAFGNRPLPVPIHGPRNRQVGLEPPRQIATTAECEHQVGEGDGRPTEAKASEKTAVARKRGRRQREEISSRKVNRGDRI